MVAPTFTVVDDDRAAGAEDTENHINHIDHMKTLKSILAALAMTAAATAGAQTLKMEPQASGVTAY